MLDQKEVLSLRAFAAEIRIGILEQLRAKGVGHIGGTMSIADVLAVLYGKELTYKAEDPKWPGRDRIICSKGHAGPAFYAALALKGFFPYEKLVTLNQPRTTLPSHCDHHKTPGIDMTTGSLGQGVSLAVGAALACRLQGRKNRVFVIVGDGECDEGQVWEAAMFASAHHLGNMIWLLDNNKKQLDGPVAEILDTGDLAEKFRAFGFDSIRIDGHDIEAIYDAIHNWDINSDKPRMIVLDTIKGKGVAEVENMSSNHSITVPYDDATRWIADLSDEVRALREEATL